MWEHTGQTEEYAGNLQTAGLCYYIAQRLMVLPSDQKSRLYLRAAQIYIETSPYHKEFIDVPHGRIASIWQESHWPNTKGVILLIPGVTFTKEELHYHALTYAQRGFHVVRIDNPVYGETQGTLKAIGLSYPAEVIKKIREKYPDLPLHLHGISYGGYLALHNADLADSWSTLSAPYNARPYFYHLPLHSQQALQAMFGDPVENVRDWITPAPIPRKPGLIIHGKKDHTIPISETSLIARTPGSMVSIFPKEGHSCPNRFYSVAALNLEWISKGRIPATVPDHY